MTTETLATYLVRLGFEVEESSTTRFSAAFEGAVIRARLVADAIEDAARRLLSAATDAARSFDQLYYASRRDNIAFDMFTAIQYAAEQTGSSAAEAASSLESLGRLLRENPVGNMGYARSAGFGLNATTGQLEYQLDLGRKFAALSTTQQEQIGHALGMSERMIDSLRRPDQFDARVRESLRSQRESGLDADAPRRAMAFMTEFRQTWQSVSNIADGGLTRLLDGLTPTLSDFARYLKDHEEDIAEAIDRVVRAILRVVEGFERFVKDVDWTAVNDELTTLAKTARTVVHALGGLTRAFEIFFALWFAGRLAAVVATIRTLGGFRAARWAGALGLWVARLGGGVPAALGGTLLLGGDTNTPDPTDAQRAEAARRTKELQAKDGGGSGWGRWWEKRPQALGGKGGWFDGGGSPGGGSGADAGATQPSAGGWWAGRPMLLGGTGSWFTGGDGKPAAQGPSAEWSKGINFGRAGPFSAQTSDRDPLDPSLKLGLEKLRREFGEAFTITSTTGGEHAPDSQHYRGRAADVSTRGMDDRTLTRLIESARRAGFTGFGIGETHLHIDTRETSDGRPIVFPDAMGADGRVAGHDVAEWTQHLRDDVRPSADDPAAPRDAAVGGTPSAAKPRDTRMEDARVGATPESTITKIDASRSLTFDISGADDPSVVAHMVAARQRAVAADVARAHTGPGAHL